MRVRNVSKGTELATAADAAATFRSRFVGLLGRSELRPGEGLLLQPCGAVHTAFMRFPIDVVYLDAALRVIKIAMLVPFRASVAFRGARSALELPAGAVEASRTAVGDVLAIDA